MGLRHCLLAGLGLAALTGAAWADPRARHDDTPGLVLSGYLFTSAIQGQASAVEGLPPAALDLSFGDVLENLDGGLMGAAEYRAGAFSLLGDAMVSQVSPDGMLPGPLQSTVELRQRALTLQATALYRVQATSTTRWDLGVGLRYSHLDTRATMAADGLGTRSRSQSRDWVDPVLAARFRGALSDRWSATAYGDYGVTGIGSEKTWQLLATLDYSWSDRVSVRIGYRALATDYRDGDYVYDVTLRGPLLGVSYRF